jgi:hypothetical protein
MLAVAPCFGTASDSVDCDTSPVAYMCPKPVQAMRSSRLRPNDRRQRLANLPPESFSSATSSALHEPRKGARESLELRSCAQFPAPAPVAAEVGGLAGR